MQITKLQRSRDSVDTGEAHSGHTPMPPTPTAGSTAPLCPMIALLPPPHPHSSSYALSPLSCLLRLSNGQPPLIPALLFLQIKFQLFVNLCENDKPVPELSFNTQKHK